MELPPREVQRHLATWPVGRLATLDRTGHPSLVPVVFVVHERVAWSPVDGKPKRSAALARLEHVERDARVSLLLDDYAEDWTRLWWIRLDGNAEVVRSKDPESDPVLAPVVGALREKYPQYGEVPLFRGAPTLLRIDVHTVTSWCAASR